MVENARPKVMRQWPNAISGWFSAYLVLGVVALLNDPLGLRSTSVGEGSAVGGQHLNLEGQMLIVYFFLLSAGSFAVLARPRVEIYSAKIVLRNVVRDVTIPLSALQEVSAARSNNLMLLANGRWFRALGIEKAHEAFFAREGIAAKVAGGIYRTSTGPRPPGEVTVQWRRWPEISEFFLSLLWLAYLVLGLLRIHV